MKFLMLIPLTLVILQLTIAQVDPNPKGDEVPNQPTHTPTPTPSPTPTPKPIINPTIIRNFSPGNAVEHTSVKDQGQVGFCWSYSGMGLIESEHLKRTGETLDLSEEYIGFMYIYEQVLANAPEYFARANKTVNASAYKKGWKRFKHKTKTKIGNLVQGLIVNFLFGVSEGAPNLDLIMSLSKKYGVVPESAFNYKIQGADAEQSVSKRIMNFVNTILRDPEKNKEYRKQAVDGSYTNEPIPEKIYEALAKAYTLEDQGRKAGTCNSCKLIDIQKGFTFDRSTYTAKTFLDNYIKFNTDNYVQINVSETNFADTMEKVRRSINDGEAVQFGMFLMSGFREAVKGNGILMPENCGTYNHCKVEGGHAILAVNSTTDEKGKLNGIIIKNSWGPFGLDEIGKKQGPLGYQIITLDYFQLAFKLYQGEGKPTQSVGWFVHINKKYNN
jgi:hypothetical protein